MNKKQLNLQNSSLFAELERKAKEIEILEIRLEESEEKSEALTKENEMLKYALERADAENKELFEKNKQLEDELIEAKTKATINNEVLNNEPEIGFEILGADNNEEPHEENEPEPTQIDLEIQKKIEEVTELTENTETVNAEEKPDEVLEVVEETKSESVTPQPAIETDLSKPANDFVTETLTPPTPFDAKKAEASADLLRDYGAKIIGRVTRVTAEVLSKISAINDDAAESLKTLALGKNESFKFQIIELAKQSGDPQRIMAEMDFLADETIVYLRSI